MRLEQPWCKNRSPAVHRNPYSEVAPKSERARMSISTNLSHWICLLAGLYLALTGLLLRDAIHAQPPAMSMPPGSRWGRGRFAGWGRRAVLVAVGLGAFAYGLSRIL